MRRLRHYRNNPPTVQPCVELCWKKSPSINERIQDSGHCVAICVTAVLLLDGSGIYVDAMLPSPIYKSVTVCAVEQAQKKLRKKLP
jgi:hypothetical protein